MTELLIVSKPRGRIHKWIYGQYKEYLDPISFDRGNFTNPLVVNATGASYEICPRDNPNYSLKYRAQRFKTPNVQTDEGYLLLQKVRLRLHKGVDGQSGTVKIELRSDNNGTPGSKIYEIASFPIDNLETAFSIQEFTLSSPQQLSPDTYYWIYIYYIDDGTNRLYWEGSSSDVYADGYAWDNQNGIHTDYDHYLEVVYASPKFTINLDFIYDGAAEKRLELTFSGTQTIDDITVNGQSVGTDLLKEDSIPQADNYSIVLTVSSGDVKGSIQRWLYYNKTSITLDDLNVSEAYIQEIEYGVDGGVLRIDDDPAGDLVGSANETIQFMDILVPFRKLEWISGGGEVLILGVE